MSDESSFAEWVLVASDQRIAYMWVLVISVWGGIVNYVRRYKSSGDQKINVAELIGELFIAGFAGLLVYWGTDYYTVPGPLAAIMIATSGLMSGRTLQVAEALFERKIKERLNISD